MKRFAIWLVSAFTVINLMFAITLHSHAAKCEAGNGASCEGQCCKATETDCVAGPCDVIFKI